MSELENLERLTSSRDFLADIDPTDLVAAGAQAQDYARRWTAVDRKIQAALLDVMATDEASIVIGVGINAEREQAAGPYEWDAAALDAKVRPLLGNFGYAEVVTVEPHVCPPPVYKVNTVRLKSLMNKLGPRGAVFHECYTRKPGPPKVKYVEVGE